MALFAIADPHLSHAVDKPMHVFGPHWHQHDKLLADHWQAIVGAQDTVLIPGDISWAMHLKDAIPDLRFLDELPGEKILLRGNHDYWWSSMAKLQAVCRQENLNSIRFLRHEGLLVSTGDVVCGTRGWILPEDPDFKALDRKIYQREVGRLEMSLQSAVKLRQPEHRLIVCLHYPPFSPAQAETEFTRLLQDFSVDECVFGHIHDSLGRYLQTQTFGTIVYRLVSADTLGFKPLRL